MHGAQVYLGNLYSAPSRRLLRGAHSPGPGKNERSLGEQRKSQADHAGVSAVQERSCSRGARTKW